MRDLTRQTDDAESVIDLLQKTLDCLQNDSVIMKLVGAQVCDVDQKVMIAITESLRLCQHAIINAAISIPGADIVGTPTIARLICDASLRSFGFSRVRSNHLEETMRQIVWQSMYKFFYMSVPILSLTMTAMVLGGPIALIPIAVNSIISTPATARVVVSCSCDIILILEHAFSVNSQWVGPREVEVAAKWYKSNLFDAVHHEVNALIPLPSLMSATISNLKRSFQFGKLRVGMKAIIDKHRTQKPANTLPAELGSSADYASEDDDDVLNRLSELQ